MLRCAPQTLFDDPYPFYAELRRHSPVHFYEPTGEWFVTRWADCQTIGANPEAFGPSADFMPMVKTMGIPNILTMTGPEHRCLRTGIDARLKGPSIDAYVEDLARPVVRARIAALKPSGRADLTRELFEPVSVRCVADALGLVDVPDATLMRWFHALNAGAQNVADDADVWRLLDEVKREIDDAVRTVYDRVSAAPDDGVLSHMVHDGEPDQRRRTLEELTPTIRVIILGGLQEPGHGAANAAYGLLYDPRQADALRAAPAELALKAFDEGLRWIAPIGVILRRATRSFTIGDATIPAGAPVAVIASSANRDEDRWDDADRFRLDRPRKPHAAFGYQPHFCSGNYLSRQIGRIVLEECFASLPDLRLDEARPVSIRGWRFRGVVSLPAQWTLNA